MTQYDNAQDMNAHQCYDYLREVWFSHYAETSKDVPGYDGPNFEEMIDLFAGDKFYKGHFVAKRYRLLSSPEGFRDAMNELLAASLLKHDISRLVSHPRKYEFARKMGYSPENGGILEQVHDYMTSVHHRWDAAVQALKFSPNWWETE